VAFVLIPRVGANLSIIEKRALLGKAQSAGFDRVIDLSGAYEHHKPEELSIAPSDYHPNPLGHQLLARQWANQLAKWPELQGRLKRPGTAQ
jgi:lysophospholipase L1-like esterase